MSTTRRVGDSTSALRSRPSALTLAAGAALSLAAMVAPASAQTFTWANSINGGTQPWGTAGNWSGPAPTAGGGADYSLIFNYNFGSTTQTSQNNLAGALSLNALTINNESAGGLTLSAAAGSTLSFTPSTVALVPSLQNNSSIAATMSIPTALSGPLNIGGFGNGNLTLGGILSGAGGLNINALGRGLVVLNAANTYTGPVNLNGGTVGVSNSGAFGAAGNTVSVNGGAMRFTATGTTVGQVFQLNTDLNLDLGAVASATGTFGSTGGLNGPGGLNIRAFNTSQVYTFQANNTFTGNYTGASVGNASFTTVLNGAGAFSNVGAMTLGPNNVLSLDSAGTNNNNRINDAAPITLHRTAISLTGNAGAPTSEDLGPITFTGTSQLSVTPNAAQNAAINAASISRSQRGTLVLFGTNLGGSGANSSNIRSGVSLSGDLFGGGGAPGSTNISILPYGMAVHGTGTAAQGHLVTFDNTAGFRPLAPTEYASAYLGQTDLSDNNLRTTTSVPAFEKYASSNSLSIDSPSAATIGSGFYMNPGAFITLNSGTMLTSISGGTTVSTLPAIIAGGTIDSKNEELVLHTQNLTAITSTLGSSNGLTKAGTGQVILAGDNTFSGPLTVSGSVIHYFKDSSLGDVGNEVVLAGGNVSGLNFAPSNMFGSSTQQSLTLPRDISLAPAGGGLSASLTNTTLHVTGDISGPGTFMSGTTNLGNIGTVKLTGNNTYSGNTVVWGNLAVDSDANLGTGSTVVLNGGALRNDGPFTSNRSFLLQGTATLFTNGADMTINGEIHSPNTATLTLIKAGPNTLHLTANNPFPWVVQLGSGSTVGDQGSYVAGGGLTLSGPNGALASAVTVNSLSNTLTLDNTAANNANRLNANVILGGSTLNFLGNAAAASTETIGTLTAGNFSPALGNGVSVVNVVPGPGQSAVLTASNFTRTGFSGMLVRGANLGGAIGAGTANLVFNTAPAMTNSVIPGMVGDTSASGNGSGFVTHAPGTGVRLLTSGEYGAMPASGVTTTTVDHSGGSASLTAATTINALRLGAGGSVDLAGFTLTNSAGMVLATGGVNGGIGGVAGSTLAFGSVPATFWTNDDLSISAGVTGTGGLLKAGPGTLTLNNPTTFTGGVNVANGTLRLNTAGALATQALTVGGTGGPGTLGTLDLNGFNHTFTSIGGIGNIQLGGATLTANGGSTVFGGNIQGNGSLVVAGSMTLIGVSSFTGDTTVRNGGTLTVAANQPAAGNGPLGSAGTLVLGDATTAGNLSFGSNVRFMDRNIVVPVSTATTIQINQNAGSNVIMGGSLTLNRQLRITGGASTASPFAGSVTLTGTIADGTTPGSLDWFGGNYNLWGNNTYTGGTILQAGSAAANTVVLGLGTDTALGTGPAIVGTFNPGALRADFGSRTLANNFYFSASGGGVMGFTGVNNLTLNGQFDLGGGAFAAATPPSVAGARTFQVTSTGLTTLGGVVSGAAGSSLTKSGGGTLVMSGNNTFLGNVTVDAGGLIVNGSNAGGGTYTVNAGGLLGGSGSIVVTGTPADAVKINAGAILEPGASPGTLSLTAPGANGLNLASGALLTYELAAQGTTGGGVNDLVAVTGNLTLPASGVVVNLLALPGFTSDPINVYTLITYTGTLTGNAASFSVGFVPPNVTSVTFDTSVTGEVRITVIPTPGSLALLGLSGLLAARRRRR